MAFDPSKSFMARSACRPLRRQRPGRTCVSLRRAIDWPVAASTAASRAFVSADELELNVGADGCGGFDVKGESEIARGHDLVLGDSQAGNEPAIQRLQ